MKRLIIFAAVTLMVIANTYGASVTNTVKWNVPWGDRFRDRVVETLDNFAAGINSSIDGNFVSNVVAVGSITGQNLTARNSLTVNTNATIDGTAAMRLAIVRDSLSVQTNATVGGTFAVTSTATFTAESVHNGGIDADYITTDAGMGIDAKTAGTLDIGTNTATVVNIGKSTVTTVVRGPLSITGGITNSALTAVTNSLVTSTNYLGASVLSLNASTNSANAIQVALVAASNSLSATSGALVAGTNSLNLLTLGRWTGALTNGPGTTNQTNIVYYTNGILGMVIWTP